MSVNNDYKIIDDAECSSCKHMFEDGELCWESKGKVYCEICVVEDSKKTFIDQAFNAINKDTSNEKSSR